MSPALLLTRLRAAQDATYDVDLRGHALDTRRAIYAARRALRLAEDVLALRSGETLARGSDPTGDDHDDHPDR